jgi:hypothetical protein
LDKGTHISGVCGRAGRWPERSLSDRKRTSLKPDKIAKSRFFRFNAILAKAGIQLIQGVLDTESVIPDLIRDRHDGRWTFYGPVKT